MFVKPCWNDVDITLSTPQPSPYPNTTLKYITPGVDNIVAATDVLPCLLVFDGATVTGWFVVSNVFFWTTVMAELPEPPMKSLRRALLG